MWGCFLKMLMPSRSAMQPMTPMMRIGVGGFARTEFAEAGPDFLLGVFADGAGVVEDDVGFVAVVDGLVALGTELA